MFQEDENQKALLKFKKFEAKPLADMFESTVCAIFLDTGSLADTLVYVRNMLKSRFIKKFPLTH
jgi:dsRNA-specific ribonuclease